MREGAAAVLSSGPMLAWRKRVPGPVRALYRLVRSAVSAPPETPSLPAELFEDARLFPSRLALIASLPKGGRVLEIGTDRGEFARIILETCAPERLDLVDIDFSRFDDRLRADGRVHCHEGQSAALVDGFAAQSFDWVYVDASHAYEDVLADARAAARAVKPGGFLVFNDFAHIDPMLGRYGVQRAVSEFLCETRFCIHAMSYERMGLYDIAIRATPAGTGNESA